MQKFGESCWCQAEIWICFEYILVKLLFCFIYGPNSYQLWNETMSYSHTLRNYRPVNPNIKFPYSKKIQKKLDNIELYQNPNINKKYDSILS